jgi:ABC-type transport system involved in Fe-S cluster assembly fused permease/ATPase subunit
MDVEVKTSGGSHFHAIRTTARLIWAEIDAFTKQRLIASFVFLALMSVLAALTPVIYKLLIDGLSGIAPPVPWITPVVLIAAFVLIQFGSRIAGTLRGFVHGKALQRLTRRIAVRLFGHVMSLSLPYHLERKTGAIGETIGQGLQGCHTILQHAVFTFLPVIVEFVTITFVLLHFGHWQYLALFTVSGVAYAVAFGYAAKAVTKPSEQLASASIDANSHMVDALLNCETVKYFNGEKLIKGRIDDAQAVVETRWGRLLGIQTANGFAIATIFTLSLGAALGLAGNGVLAGTLTVGDFVLINTYAVRLVQPLETIGYAVRDMSQALGFLQKMLHMLDERPELDSGHQILDLSTVRGEVTFENVSLSYGTGRFGLRDITFTVPAGRTVAVVGASGSGKSSLVRLLFRLYEPQSGRILLDGMPISSLSLRSLRSAIAVVPQDTVLFNDTLGANLALADPDAAQGTIEKAAQIANLDTFINSLPERYGTSVGERGLKLSGGEKQRVAIARAALKRPRVFVCDEATSSLDSRTETAIIQNLRAVARDCTTLVIAHRLSTVVHADEILVLHLGAIVERGTHTSLLALDGRYAALWRAQHSSMPAHEAVQAATA